MEQPGAGPGKGRVIAPVDEMADVEVVLKQYGRDNVEEATGEAFVDDYTARIGERKVAPDLCGRNR